MPDTHDAISLVCDVDSIRVDRFLSEQSSLSRKVAADQIAQGKVFINGAICKKSALLSIGDTVSYFPPIITEPSALPEDIPLSIVYEDKDLLVVNKPKGLVVHPAPGNPNGTLVNALMYHCKDSLSGINGVLRPGIVHRIDKDTSGLLIVAKNDLSHTGLAKMFSNHSFLRTYHTIVYGTPKAEEGTIRLAIGRSHSNRKKMATYPLNTPGAKNAITHFRVLERFNGYTYVECQLETGRTHQIRVHMLSISCPVLADPVYAAGRETFGLQGQCLHAKTIAFHHPITGESLSFDSPLPGYFSDVLEKLRSRA